MSEPTAGFAVGEFAKAVGDKRRSADRKSFVPALEFSSSFFLNYPKQEFTELPELVLDHNLLHKVLQ